jgi:uncharacterized protein
MMEAYDFVQLTLLAMGGEIKGKTKLQKTVYFLGLMTGCLEDLGYRPHFYGPYSNDVADAMSRLKTIGAVDQNVRGGGAVDKSGFEVCRYDFSLNDEGKELASETTSHNSELWKKLAAAAEAFKKVGDLDYMELSVAAKTYFMLGEKKGRATQAELAHLARRFGWEVTPDQIREALRYLGNLGLVEFSAN